MGRGFMHLWLLLTIRFLRMRKNDKILENGNQNELETGLYEIAGNEKKGAANFAVADIEKARAATPVRQLCTREVLTLEQSSKSQKTK